MTVARSDDDLVAIFEGERSRLRGIAYRMLGTHDDADDVVQEAWFRLAASGDPIDNPAAWLTTVVSRLAIDELRSARHKRENYVGPWMAEPFLDTSVLDSPSGAADPGAHVVLLESISLGFLAVMERLSALERAVFILHDVFAIPLSDVALIIDRNDAATRQLAKRARDHIAKARPRFNPDPGDVEALVGIMLSAAATGDLETLESYLAEDVVHLSDGGAAHRAARRPVVGPARVARLFINLAPRIDPEAEVHVVVANGQPALYTTLHGQPFMVHVTNWVDGKMTGSFAVLNPDKLQAFHAAWIATQSPN